MPRLPYYDPADGPDAIAEHLERTPLGLFRMVAHAQSAFEPWLRLIASTGLEPEEPIVAGSSPNGLAE